MAPRIRPAYQMKIYCLTFIFLRQKSLSMSIGMNTEHSLAINVIKTNTNTNWKEYLSLFNENIENPRYAYVAASEK